MTLALPPLPLDAVRIARRGPLRLRVGTVGPWSDGVDLLSCGHLYTRPIRDLPGDVPKGKKRRCGLCAADTVEDRRRAYERRYYRSGAKTKSRCPHYVQQRSSP